MLWKQLTRREAQIKDSKPHTIKLNDDFDSFWTNHQKGVQKRCAEYREARKDAERPLGVRINEWQRIV